ARGDPRPLRQRGRAARPDLGRTPTRGGDRYPLVRTSVATATAPRQTASGMAAPMAWTSAAALLRCSRAALASLSPRSASAKQVQTVRLAAVAVQTSCSTV